MDECVAVLEEGAKGAGRFGGGGGGLVRLLERFGGDAGKTLDAFDGEGELFVASQGDDGSATARRRRREAVCIAGVRRGRVGTGL